ncbi:NADH-dependent flavin oxidoreductase [Furfurilactobacillus milii]
MNMSYQFLKPYTFRSGVTVKNRIAIPPMTEGMSLENGEVSTDELNYFNIHTGGAGMFITPVANVNALGKGFEGELSVADDKFIPGLAKLAATIKQNGTKAILQIFSAGRMTNSRILRGHQPVSASAVAALRPHAETPRALSEDEIEQTIADFGAATKRAILAGFDGVELHGANTYLLQQFFSPHSNRREDQWGGSLENRMRFPVRVIEAAQQAIADTATSPFLLGYRLSPEEIEEPGIRIEDTLKFVSKLNDMKLDYLHISMGNVWRPSLNNHDDKEPLITKIQRVSSDTPLISVGNVNTPADAEKVIEAGITFAAIGRESIREPHWVQKVEAGTEQSIRYSLSLADLEELGIKTPFFEFLKKMNDAGADQKFDVNDAQTKTVDTDRIDVAFRK